MTRRNRQHGFTLIEMMVSIAVLAIIILIANELMVQALRTVKLSQEKMQVQADGRAVAEMIRTDVQAITRTGYLCIVSASTTNLPISAGWPVFDSVGFVKVAPFCTVTTSNEVATSVKVDYGLANVRVPDTATFSGTCLFRRSMGLAANLSPQATGNDEDYVCTSLSELALNGRYVAPLRFLVANGGGGYTPGYLVPPGQANGRQNPIGTDYPIYLPVSNINVDMKWNWPYLVSNCQKFNVAWTYGDVSNGNVVWRGIDLAMTAGPLDLQWMTRDSQYQSQDPNAARPEFNLRPGGPNVYCALWTARERRWPKALRFRYTLGRPDLKMDFETIVDLVR